MPTTANAPRKTKADLAAEALERLVAAKKPAEPDPDGFGRGGKDVRAGVSASWLAGAFDMARPRVVSLLSDCDPIRHTKEGPVWSLADAARYLVPPDGNIENYIKHMRIEDLPVRLQKSYWGAKTQQQKWQENAGDLWRTFQVLETFGSVFQLVKSQVQLWPDTLERDGQLTSAQKARLEKLTDDMQDELYEKVVQAMKGHDMKSLLGEDREEYPDETPLLHEDVASLV